MCNSVIRQKGRACESTTASNRRVAEIDDFGEGRARQRCQWAKQADYPTARRVAQIKKNAPLVSLSKRERAVTDKTDN
jgi:hypothetical protein